MDNPILVLVFRWLHILPAIALVGGAMFLRIAYRPSADDSDGGSSDASELTRRRWAKLVMVSAALLLVSGLFNTAVIAIKYQFPDGYYHPVLGVKIMLAMGVFFLSSLLSGRSEAARKFRQKEKLWSNVNLLLAVSVVMVGGVLKTADREEKKKVDNQETRQTAPLRPVAEV